MIAALLLALQAAPTPAPAEIVAAAKPAEWVTIGADDLLVMELAADAAGKPRRVVIQLIPAPFSQGWVANIRTLAKARWWDGLTVNRVQDNYVVQWGDASEKKPLPAGLKKMAEAEYSWRPTKAQDEKWGTYIDAVRDRLRQAHGVAGDTPPADSYTMFTSFLNEFPIGVEFEPVAESLREASSFSIAPVHCYGTVGVGRNLSPDTGSGAELYTVIGHAPRHLDRNIAVVGRVVEGIEHLSSLPRGTEALGFYKAAAERVPIRSIRLASDLPAAERPRMQYLSTEGPSFTAYAHARANRRDAFFIRPAGGADICNVPVPVRRAP